MSVFATTLDYRILISLILKGTLVLLDVVQAYSFIVDYHVARNSARRIRCHMLLFYQAIHLRSQTNKLCYVMSVVFVLEDGSRQLLAQVEERELLRSLFLSTSCWEWFTSGL